MTSLNTHKFVIDMADQKINTLSDTLNKAKQNDDSSLVDTISGEILGVFDFLKSYVSELELHKNKLNEDIESANALLDRKISVLQSDTDEFKTSIKEIEFKNKDYVDNINDSLNQITLGVFQAGEKAKEIKQSINIHIKDTESFILNKQNALAKMLQKVDNEVKSVSDYNFEVVPDSVSGFTSSCDIEMASEQFEDFVNFVKDNNAEITDLEGETDDGQTLYINQNKKIRPPLDVIVNKELSLNITSGSIKTISDNGSVVWRDIEDYVDEYIEFSNRYESTENETETDNAEQTVDNKNDSFLNTVLNADELLNIKDEKFFSKLKLQGEVFIEMIEKIDKNQFSFILLDATMIAKDEGEDEKITIDTKNVLCPSVEYIRKNAKNIVVNKAAVKTNTGEMIGLMEALILLD